MEHSFLYTIYDQDPLPFASSELLCHHSLFWLLTEKKVSIDLEMSPCDVTKTKSRLSGLETTQGKSSKHVGRFEKIH